MNCCVNCFADQGLQNRIISESKTKGNCHFCESQNVMIIPCAVLSEMFEPIFDLYINHPTAVLSLKEERPALIDDHLRAYWPQLFNSQKLNVENIRDLVIQIGQSWNGFEKELFEMPVELETYISGNAAEESHILQWAAFAKDIKEHNRFFLKEALDFEFLESILTRFSKVYLSEQKFFRARISDQPLVVEELGKPPKAKTSPGRANPVGIPYLYVSDKEETTLYETRVSLHESISIGVFKLKGPLQVISLKDIGNYGPFDIIDKGFDIEEFMNCRSYLLKLEEELSKPVRKQDVNLDYLPTQYLCEYIKSRGFDAVEYRSAMTKDGFNLAVFNDKSLECIDTKHYRVNNLKYEWNLYS